MVRFAMEGLPTRPRVLLIDDHVLVLEALEALLRDTWEIVGKVSDTDAAIPAIDAVR
jgi:DNA-binding NarL/FixJ family response regulator